MDSGNSNNIQSSSGCDDEFDTLPDSVPPFLNPSNHFNPSLVSHHQDHPPTLFEPSSSQSMLGAQELNQVPFPSSSSMQPRPVDDVNGVTKNPKKRTRASRKAPTTVLTTDTTNFRAMVQEFTGIPAPPFSGSSSFSRMLDLFGSGSSGIRSNHLEPLRSSAKRVQPATPLLSINIPLVEASNMLNLQTQMLQPPPLHPSLNLPGFEIKSQGSSASASTSTVASFAELGLSHGINANLSGLQRNWRDGVRLNDGNQDHLRPFNGIYGNNHSNSQRLNSFKLNYLAASSSDFHHEKGLKNISSKAEGTVDSWVCPAE